MANVSFNSIDIINHLEISRHNKKVHQIKKDIEIILQDYAFKLSNPEIRKSMCHTLSIYLEKEVVDETTDKMVDEGSLFFVVKADDKEYPLITYIEQLEIIERRNKILKIKKVLNERYILGKS